MYYLTAYRAEINNYDKDHIDLSLGYGWIDLVAFVKSLDDGARDGSFIDKARRDHLQTAIHRMRKDKHA